MELSHLDLSSCDFLYDDSLSIYLASYDGKWYAPDWIVIAESEDDAMSMIVAGTSLEVKRLGGASVRRYKMIGADGEHVLKIKKEPLV